MKPSRLTALTCLIAFVGGVVGSAGVALARDHWPKTPEPVSEWFAPDRPRMEARPVNKVDIGNVPHAHESSAITGSGYWQPMLVAYDHDGSVWVTPDTTGKGQWARADRIKAAAPAASAASAQLSFGVQRADRWPDATCTRTRAYVECVNPPPGDWRPPVAPFWSLFRHFPRADGTGIQSEVVETFRNAGDCGFERGRRAFEANFKEAGTTDEFVCREHEADRP